MVGPTPGLSNYLAEAAEPPNRVPTTEASQAWAPRVRLLSKLIERRFTTARPRPAIVLGAWPQPPLRASQHAARLIEMHRMGRSEASTRFDSVYRDLLEKALVDLRYAV